MIEKMQKKKWHEDTTAHWMESSESLCGSEE